MTKIKAIQERKREEYLQSMKESHIKFLKGNIDIFCKEGLTIEDCQNCIDDFIKYAIPMFLPNRKIGFKFLNDQFRSAYIFKKYTDLYFFEKPRQKFYD